MSSAVLLELLQDNSGIASAGELPLTPNALQAFLRPGPQLRLPVRRGAFESLRASLGDSAAANLIKLELRSSKLVDRLSLAADTPPDLGGTEAKMGLAVGEVPSFRIYGDLPP